MPSLRDYLPVYEKNYDELKDTETALDPEIYGARGTYADIEQLENDLFIEPASENGIERFERILRITPNSNDSLELRRSRVLIKWNNRVPYTIKVLKNRLTSICGEGNVELDTSELTEYTLGIITHFMDAQQPEELQMLLDMMLPANLAVLLKNELNFASKGAIYSAAHTYTAKNKRPPIYECYSMVSESNMPSYASAWAFEEKRIRPVACAGYNITSISNTNSYTGVMQYQIIESEVKEK